MCDNVNSNPFVGLFSTINDAVLYSTRVINAESNDKYTSQSIEENNDKDEKLFTTQVSESCQIKSEIINKLMADVFGLRLKSKEGTQIEKELIFIDTDSVENAIFERLMISNPKTKLILQRNSNGTYIDGHILDAQVIPYLYESFCRLRKYRANQEFSDDINNLQHIILRNVATALQEPGLFESQEIHYQFIALFMENISITPELSVFTNGIVTEICSGNEDTWEDIINVSFSPILAIIHKEAVQSNLLIFRQYWFSLLYLFSSIEPLAKLLIRYNKPKSNQGRDYSNTLLGALFRLSCLPETIDAEFDFFDKPFEKPTDTIKANIWTALDALSESLQRIFHSLLKCSAEVRHMTLQWIGNCLHANTNRGKLWNSHNDINFGASLCVSDGFMLNLGSMLLHLCQPFCVKLNDTKVPKIDPTYCAVEAADENESRIRGLHMKGMTQETCLIPTPEDHVRPIAKSFGFVTECFFLTHRALDLGYRVVLDKLMRSEQDLASIQRVFNDSRNGGSSEVMEMITQRLEMEMTKYLSLKASLLAPEMLNLLAKFHATTAHWLIQVNLNEINEKDDNNDYAPKQHRPLTFPLSEIVPITLRCIPEFVVENTIGFLCFLRRFNPYTFEEQGESLLNPILTEIIMLMDQHRLYNPHLRARLAEGLGSLLPTTEEGVNPGLGPLRTFHRQQLFKTHPHANQIVSHLLQVFVNIEMTGQSVQFEQKFNYRRPMYIVMQYLWKLPEHRNKFVILAQDAEANMEAVHPPLFLCFINLLMNDAVFLLDEALSNMSHLRQMIHARETGEWNKLPQHERVQQENYLQHIGTIAQFDNILGRKTIQTIKMLTSEIKSIFCHPTMVDRIASMLNYLLLQLVGPNKKNLKVNDQKEYGFDPANLVLDICEIYVNLSENKSFTLAVSQDGRSYSPDLFKLADNVLVRIGGLDILGDLNQFAKNVEKAANQKKEEDEILTEAPEEFLDPIMSTLMVDPVTLPSSRITIDRQTIARHLLSDQTDPFNRSPLTMDMVKSNTELRNKIQEWIAKKKEDISFKI
ncbi:ubiquitin conjugation factor E4 A-like [Vespa mandarinia]|uniref:ubiquitin conjugation factor E4 A-like n=1 Tax=Vespa mandarinia TaxID=7446 RepID=UPI00161FCBC3|nr:ubiquitin conjugation factor E4 A-like [Vespa mandarinia]